MGRDLETDVMDERKPHSLRSDSERVNIASYDIRKAVTGHYAAEITGF